MATQRYDFVTLSYFEHVAPATQTSAFALHGDPIATSTLPLRQIPVSQTNPLRQASFASQRLGPKNRSGA